MAIEVQDSGSEARAWVEANRELAEAAFQDFLATGEWTKVLTLQHRLDVWSRERPNFPEVDVQKAVDDKPSVPQEVRLVHSEYLTLRVRDLMWVASAEDLVLICLRVIKRAVEVYYATTDNPQVSSEDPAIAEFTVSLDPLLKTCAYQVLIYEHPSPFGGGGMQGDGTWSITVDSRFARKFRNINKIEDFVARQDQIRAETQRVADEATKAWEAHGGLTTPGFSVFSRVRVPVSTSLGEDERLEEGDSFEWPSDVTASDADTPSTGVDDEEKPLLFISWGRDVSKGVATVLHSHLTTRFEGVNVFFSPKSIGPGTNPTTAMFDKGLLVAEALVAVLTADGAGSPYVVWETASVWGRGKTVIPVFVDIEPDDVPGPLSIMAQGVKLDSREDLDRAIETLARDFGLNKPAPLTSEEFAELLDAAQQSEPIDPEQQVQKAIRQLRGHLARWRSLFSDFDGDPSFDSRIELAAEIRRVLLELTEFIRTTAPNAPILGGLQEISSQAAAVSRKGAQVRIGQVSLDELTGDCQQLLSSLDAALG